MSLLVEERIESEDKGNIKNFRTNHFLYQIFNDISNSKNSANRIIVTILKDLENIEINPCLILALGNNSLVVSSNSEAFASWRSISSLLRA